MTETKTTHTTGEWLAADDDPLFIYALAEDGYNAFDLRVQGRKEYRAEQLAAARLIAASKRLYEALKEIKCWIPSTGQTAAENGCKCDTLGEAFELMEQALAAAEGEQYGVTRTVPLCCHCGRPLTQHGRFARCSDGEHQFTEVPEAGA